MSKLELSVYELEMKYSKVNDGWKASSYFKAGFKIDDIDLLQRAGSLEAVIKIEVEKGKEEFDLYFTLDGKLISRQFPTPTMTLTKNSCPVRYSCSSICKKSIRKQL